MFDIAEDTEVVSVLRSAYTITHEVTNGEELLRAVFHLEAAMSDLICKYGDDFLKAS